MTKPVIWSPLADADLDNITEYLNQNWETQVVLNFLDQLDDLIALIQNNPKLFPVINDDLGIRKCVVTKHNTLFYRIKPDKIEIVRIYDNRQDPEKLTFL